MLQLISARFMQTRMESSPRSSLRMLFFIIVLTAAYADGQDMPVPSPPSNLSVSQTSLTSVVVSWTPSLRGANGYIIYYKQQQTQEKFSKRVLDNSIPSVVVSNLRRGGNYSFSMVATNNATVSMEIGPLNINLGIMSVYSKEIEPS